MAVCMIFGNLGLVVQSLISLTISLMINSFTVVARVVSNTLILFARRNVGKFSFFSAKNINVFAIYQNRNFNTRLANNLVNP